MGRSSRASRPLAPICSRSTGTASTATPWPRPPPERARRSSSTAPRTACWSSATSRAVRRQRGRGWPRQHHPHRTGMPAPAQGERSATTSHVAIQPGNLSVARTRGFKIPAGYDGLMPQFEAARAALAVRGRPARRRASARRSGGEARADSALACWLLGIRARLSYRWSTFWGSGQTKSNEIERNRTKSNEVSLCGTRSGRGDSADGPCSVVADGERILFSSKGLRFGYADRPGPRQPTTGLGVAVGHCAKC